MEVNIMDIANLVYKLAEQPAEVADKVIAEFEATKGERSEAIRAIALCTNASFRLKNQIFAYYIRWFGEK